MNLADILAYEGALDALVASLQSAGHTVKNVTTGHAYLRMIVDGTTIEVSRFGEMTGGTASLQAKVKAQLEALNRVVTIELTAARIEALTRNAEREYADNGALLLTVEV